MPPDDPPMTEGTVKVMFKQIQKDLDEIKKDHKEDKNTLHNRVNDVEKCINEEVKPDLHKNMADLEWLKKGFWYLAGIGSSALLLSIGIIASSAMGG